MANVTLNGVLKNISVYSNDHLLWLLNEEAFKTNIPAIIFMGICMGLGIAGNALTVYVYHFRMKKSSGHIFITWLAAFDLISCSIAIPYEIFDLRFPLMYGESVSCKICRTVAFTTNLCSGLTLIFLAFDRLHVTHAPFKSFTQRKAKYLVSMGIFIALLLSSPSPIVFGSRQVETSIPGVVGIDCSFSDLVVGTVFPTVYYSFLALVFFITFIILGVVYIKIAIAIWKWKNSDIGFSKSIISRGGSLKSQLSTDSDVFRYSSMKRRPSNNNVLGSENTAIEESTTSDTCPHAAETGQRVNRSESRAEFGESRMCLCCCRNDEKEVELVQYVGNSQTINADQSNLSHKAHRFKKSDSVISLGDSIPNISSSINSKLRKRRKTVKEKASLGRSNGIFITITVVFVLSYLPFLLLELLRRVGVIGEESLSGIELELFELGTKSVYLNNVINPIVYGVMNPKYRQATKELFQGKTNIRRYSFK